ncbi:MAG: 16S rRNA processing protein RimM [Acidobacteria bacterium]|nr:16S rRNA processing protein RimM [Acidobacteriota bacterium]
MSPEFLTIGKIARPQGIRGEVIVNVETDFPSRFFDETVFLVRTKDGTSHQMTSEKARMHKGRVVIKFQSIDTMNDAERLRDAEILIPVEKRNTDDADFFYHYELVGMSVIATDGHTVGRVTEVLVSPGQDILVVQGKDGEVLVFRKEICIEVDRETERITVDMPEGLEEINR